MTAPTHLAGGKIPLVFCFIFYLYFGLVDLISFGFIR
jgi:hypothetical protein